MRRRIFIHLGDPTPSGDMPEEISWLVQNQDGSIGPIFRGDLKTASNHAGGCQVIVLVSGVEVLLTSIELPNMNRQRLVKAIPYALEEQLASDIDDLHFAIGNRDSEGNISVAVVEKEMIENWLHELHEANIQPDFLASETLGTQWYDDQWLLLAKNAAQGSSTKAILRSGPQAGMVIDMNNIVPLLRSSLEILEEDKRPARLQLVICEEPQSLSADSGSNLDSEDEVHTLERNSVAKQIDAFADELSELCERLHVDLELLQKDETFLQHVAQHFDEQLANNMLQGEYSRKEQLEKFLRPWKPAIAIAIAWMCLQFGLLISDYYQVKSTHEALKQEIASVFKEALPDSKYQPGYEKKFMGDAIVALRSDGQQSVDMFSLLTKAGEVLSNTETFLLRTMRYKSSTLDLDFEISDLQSLDELKLRLSNEAKLSVEILSASSRRGKVESRMKLSIDSKLASNSP